jgi:DNA modification methylase
MRDPQQAHNPLALYRRENPVDTTVIQGDCKSVLQTLPHESVDFVLTDPPYLGHYKDRYGRTLANDDDPAAVVGAYSELYRVLKPNRFCISFCGYPKLDAFVHAWTEAGFDTVGHIVWPSPMFPASASSRLLMSPLTFSRPGDLVLDPFSSSSSTWVAAALSGRQYMGIDLEAKYVDLARRRLAGVLRAGKPVAV